MCDRACLKGSSMFFNVFFLFTGIAMFGMSIWMAVDDQLYYSVLTVKPDLEQNPGPWNGTVWGLLVISLVCIFASILGMCGSGCDSSGTLIAFLVFGSLAIVGTLIYASFATWAWGRLDEDNTPKDMYTYLTTDYVNEVATDDFSEAWNDLQVSDECCGVYDYKDYVASAFTNTTKQPVPWTCCVMKDTDEVDINQVLNIDECLAEAAQLPSQNKTLMFLNAHGCGNSTFSYLDSKGITVYAIVWTCMILQLAALIVSGSYKNNLKYNKIDPS